MMVDGNRLLGVRCFAGLVRCAGFAKSVVSWRLSRALAMPFCYWACGCSARYNTIEPVGVFGEVDLMFLAKWIVRIAGVDAVDVRRGGAPPGVHLVCLRCRSDSQCVSSAGRSLRGKTTHASVVLRVLGKFGWDCYACSCPNGNGVAHFDRRGLLFIKDDSKIRHHGAEKVIKCRQISTVLLRTSSPWILLRQTITFTVTVKLEFDGKQYAILARFITGLLLKLPHSAAG